MLLSCALLGTSACQVPTSVQSIHVQRVPLAPGLAPLASLTVSPAQQVSRDLAQESQGAYMGRFRKILHVIDSCTDLLCRPSHWHCFPVYFRHVLFSTRSITAFWILQFRLSLCHGSHQPSPLQAQGEWVPGGRTVNLVTRNGLSQSCSFWCNIFQALLLSMGLLMPFTAALESSSDVVMCCS